MDISYLLASINGLSWYEDLIAALRLSRTESRLTVLDAVKPFVIAAIHQKLNLPMLVIKSHYDSAKKLCDDLQIWSPHASQVMYYPETDLLSRDLISTDQYLEIERLRCLSALSHDDCNYSVNTKPPLVVATASSAIIKTISKTFFCKSLHQLVVGAKISPLKLIEKLQKIGYELDNLVEIPGTMSRRGGILDVFPITNEEPVRIEFYGDQIESIRAFDPKTQRSTCVLKTICLEPAKSANSKLNSDIIVDYLPKRALLILDEVKEIETSIINTNLRVREVQAETKGNEINTENDLCLLSFANFKEKIGRIDRKILLSSWASATENSNHDLSIPSRPVAHYGGNIGSFSRELKQSLVEGNRVVVVTQQSHRLSELLQGQDIIASPLVDLNEIPRKGTITIIQGNLSEGWAIRDLMTMFTDTEVFGFVKKQRLLARKIPVRHHLLSSEFIPGSFVVHIEHGIGKFIGLIKISNDDLEREYMMLEYAAGDKLYVPADQMDRVCIYLGGSDQIPNLTRLGTQEWVQTKQRIKKSVVDIAEELLKLYAVRETVKGFSFSKDTIWQQEMESSFPYFETPDQLMAIQAIKADMENSKPMDRLVCGDVGYGKTEIAIRAAFKSVMDNKQVAILVPTTLLAHQHMVTFCERLKAFPVNIKVLSRLSSEKEQEDIISQLESGTVDICIGTHRMLQKDVIFKNLGLLVIDEEQRFGVAHKEYLKKMKQEIDVITLSATPIPRTVHMALAGIRDLSTMETPPEDRLPIKTYVGFYDDKLVRDAILRELGRDGQAFFVHNRVNNIEQVAEHIRRLVPEAKISFVHGQMKEDQMEEVMKEFIDGRKDVLVSTTIIESGLDIPNVNTLIISDSDRLGLSQLYQLRGRIGRGSTNAFAYFLFNNKKQLTSQARKRLETIANATELGAGFAIAMKDLEIRGAGNILGAEQSGYVAVVGFDLYSKLLSEAVEESKEYKVRGIISKQKIQKTISVSLPLTYNIPVEYINDDAVRIIYYQRLALARDSSEISALAIEINDKYGGLPQQVINLIYMLNIKSLAHNSDVENVSTKGSQIILNFKEQRDLNILKTFVAKKDGIKIGTQQVIINVKQCGNRWQETLTNILQLLQNEGKVV